MLWPKVLWVLSHEASGLLRELLEKDEKRNGLQVLVPVIRGVTPSDHIPHQSTTPTPTHQYWGGFLFFAQLGVLLQNQSNHKFNA